MILTIPLVVLPFYVSQKAFEMLNPDDINGSLPEFYEKYKQSLVIYGATTGGYFLVLSVILLLLFWTIFRLIDSSK